MPESLSQNPLTRVVVVTDDGVKEFWADEWSVHVQDDGRTLKLFPKGDGKSAQAQRNESLGKLLVADMQRTRIDRDKKDEGTP